MARYVQLEEGAVILYIYYLASHIFTKLLIYLQLKK